MTEVIVDNETNSKYFANHPNVSILSFNGLSGDLIISILSLACSSANFYIKDHMLFRS